jgi:hypothetical protein
VTIDQPLRKNQSGELRTTAISNPSAEIALKFAASFFA